MAARRSIGAAQRSTCFRYFRCLNASAQRGKPIPDGHPRCQSRGTSTVRQIDLNTPRISYAETSHESQLPSLVCNERVPVLFRRTDRSCRMHPFTSGMLVSRLRRSRLLRKAQPVGNVLERSIHQPGESRAGGREHWCREAPRISRKAYHPSFTRQRCSIARHP